VKGARRFSGITEIEKTKERREMLLLSNFLYSIAVVLRLFLQFQVLSIIIYTLFGLFNPDIIPGVKSFFGKMSSLTMKPVARVFPRLRGEALDFTPLVTVLIIVFIDLFLVSSLFDFAQHLR